MKLSSVFLVLLSFVAFVLPLVAALDDIGNTSQGGNIKDGALQGGARVFGKDDRLNLSLVRKKNMRRLASKGSKSSKSSKSSKGHGKGYHGGGGHYKKLQRCQGDCDDDNDVSEQLDYMFPFLAFSDYIFLVCSWPQVFPERPLHIRARMYRR